MLLGYVGGVAWAPAPSAPRRRCGALREPAHGVTHKFIRVFSKPQTLAPRACKGLPVWSEKQVG